MFGMIPFERSNDNFFDLFDNFERKFFGNSSASLPDFRTDIRDAGDRFILEAELPGFQKEDIKLDLKEAERGACKGYGITWRPQTRRTFQTAAFEKAHPNIDLSPFYKTSESRVLRITVNKEAI